MTPFHVRLLRAMSPAADRHGLALTGAPALRAHGLSGCPGGGLAFAGAGETPLPDVAHDLAGALLTEGCQASVVEASPYACRLTVWDAGGECCEVTLAREALREPPVTRDGITMAGLSDLAGLRTRDLHERGLAGDVADVAALAGTFSFRRLEQLAAAHLDGFSPHELLMRLEFVELMADESFEAHGLDEHRIGEIRAFARTWAEDIKLRRADDGDADYDDPDVPEVD